MCGTYYLGSETLQGIYRFVKNMDGRLTAGSRSWSKDLFPADLAPVIISDGNRKAKLSLQRWGYPGIENKGVIFNARQESVLDKRMFSNGIRYHRAVIPADHFYEWNANKEKYIFRRNDGKPVLMAGFFDVLQNEERFVILTTDANASMKPVHDRIMPVILEENQLEDWLYDRNAYVDILKQRPVLLERETPYEQLTLF